MSAAGLEGFERIHLGHIGHARVGEQVIHEPRQPAFFAHEQMRVPVEIVIGLDAPSHQRLADRPNG